MPPRRTSGLRNHPGLQAQVRQRQQESPLESVLEPVPPQALALALVLVLESVAGRRMMQTPHTHKAST